MEVAEREISDLPLVASVVGTDVFPLSRDGSSKLGSALQIAGYVVALLTSGAPTALDTWLEIVQRLEDDEDALASLLASLATKASIAGTETLTNKTLTSPSLGGTPTAPTASPGTNTMQVATTAFVRANQPTSAQVGSGMAGLTAQDPGDFAFAGLVATNTAITVGQSYAGSAIAPAAIRGTNSAANLVVSGSSLSGTWIALGGGAAGGAGVSTATLFRRIA